MFFIFPPCFFPYPAFTHPPTPEPPAALPATPQDRQGSANESSTAAFLPRDKNLQVWCNPSLCLSCCLTPITCSAPNDSTSQSYCECTISGFSWLLPLGMTTACLVEPGTQKKKHIYRIYFSFYRVKISDT